MTSKTVLASFLLGLALVACSSDDDTQSSSGGQPATGCSADNRKDTFAAGMSKPAGNLSIALASANPAPPAKGTNALTIEVHDSGGQPVDGATVTVTPFMPDHGHGSAVVPVVAPMGSGRYDISKVYLSMAGLWRITVTVNVQNSPPQEATFSFCLDG